MIKKSHFYRKIFKVHHRAPHLGLFKTTKTTIRAVTVKHIKHSYTPRTITKRAPDNLKFSVSEKPHPTPTAHHRHYTTRTSRRTKKCTGHTACTFCILEASLYYFASSMIARRFKYFVACSLDSPTTTTSTSTPAALRTSATAFARASARPLLYSSEPIVSV